MSLSISGPKKLQGELQDLCISWLTKGRMYVKQYMFIYPNSKQLSNNQFIQEITGRIGRIPQKEKKNKANDLPEP